MATGSNENAINLIVSQEAINQLNVAIAQVEALDKAILKTASDSATISAKLSTIKTPSGVGGNASDNATVTAQLQAQARQIAVLEASIIKLTEAKRKLNETSVEEQVNQRVLLQNATLEAKAVSTMVGAYANLDAEHKKALKSAQNMGAQYGITSEQFKKASARANELDAQLKDIDANLGRHQRNVGNYASGFNALNNSINQLTREAPAFANSVNTGFMAISNNLPALADAIAGIRKQNAELRAEGQPTKSVLTQLAGAFFSWQTAISTGITLLTVYGGKLIEYINGTADAKKATEELTKAYKLQDEMLRGLGETITHKSKIAMEQAKQVNASTVTLNKIEEQGVRDQLKNLENIRDARKKEYEEWVKTEKNRRLEYLETKLLSEANVKARLVQIEKEIRGEKNLRTNAMIEAENAVKKQGFVLSELIETNQTKLHEEQEQANKKTKEQREKDLEDAKKVLEKLRKAEFELAKQRLELAIANDDEIAKNEEKSDADRIMAIQDRRQIQEELLRTQRDFELNNAENTADDRKRIQEKFDYDMIQLAKATAEEIKAINEFDTALYEKELARKLSLIEISNNDLVLEEERRFQAEKAVGYKNNKEKEKQAQEHEKNLFEIKKKGLIETAKLQQEQLQIELDAYKKFAEADGVISQKEADFILGIQKNLSDATVALYKAENSEFKAKEKGKTKDAELNAKEILEISSRMLGNLSDLANAFTERRIQNLERELEATNEFYDNQINQEITGDKKRKELEAEKLKREKEIQKQIGKEKERQAKIDKAVAIAQIGIQTALAIIKATPNVALMVLSAVTGAISLATAIATPIPKYKGGRMGGKEEFAIVGDGGVHEVITDASGNNPVLTPKTPTITHLNRGDIVHKSMEDFSVFKIAKMKEVEIFGQHKDNNALLYEMQQTRKAIEKQKVNINVHNKPVDINYALWRNSQIHWQ